MRAWRASRREVYTSSAVRFALFAPLACLLGCGTSWQVCTGTCPVVAGEYAVQSNTLAGACDFAPYLLGPSISLTQVTSNSAQTSLVDPTQSFPVQLTGDVLVPEGSSDETIAAVEMQSQVTRLLSADSSSLDTFSLRFQADLSTGGHLSGQLQTTDLGTVSGDQPCVSTIVFSAQR